MKRKKSNEITNFSKGVWDFPEAHILNYRTIALEDFLDRKRDEINKAMDPVRCVQIFEEIETRNDRDARWMKTQICFAAIPRTFLIAMNERIIEARLKLYDALDAKLVSFGGEYAEE